MAHGCIGWRFAHHRKVEYWFWQRSALSLCYSVHLLTILFSLVKSHQQQNFTLESTTLQRVKHPKPWMPPERQPLCTYQDFLCEEFNAGEEEKNRGGRRGTWDWGRLLSLIKLCVSTFGRPLHSCQALIFTSRTFSTLFYTLSIAKAIIRVDTYRKEGWRVSGLFEVISLGFDDKQPDL